MRFETIILDPFNVVGISVRTINQGGQSQKDIGQLWQEFYSGNVMTEISDRESDDIYCIYTGYESDAMGPYTCVLGCRVQSNASIPHGLQRVHVPGGRYQLYTSTGKIPDAVLNTWMGIWRSDVSRKYAVDFDIYGHASQDPEHGVVETYLSVK
ncbi:MAG TPA: GyrI-like domain-containing protein [Flavisolibacter sp.]|nr:GyrI-like domain-containing protein [Flavisolibacter sp.]